MRHCRARSFPRSGRSSGRRAAEVSHEQERRKFLRIQVLREVTLSSRQAIGLEPWGRMKVEYDGLDAALPWIHEHALTLGMPA